MLKSARKSESIVKYESGLTSNLIITELRDIAISIFLL